MKRAVVFAHYDIENLVDDYVLYYLKELKKNVEKVVFVSCNELSDVEKEKLVGYADVVIAEPHKEYDFGSYKRGFEVLKSEGLQNYDEIIFANDSCYGPIYPISNVFEKMYLKKYDFWGLTKNFFGLKGKSEHIQSYFIVFRKNVFTSDVFLKFMSEIKEESEKDDVIIKYELGLSKLLHDNGFKSAAYVRDYRNIGNITLRRWKKIIRQDKMPLIKCSILRLKFPDVTTADGWEKVVKSSKYPDIEMINKNLARTRASVNREVRLPSCIKEKIYFCLPYLPSSKREKFINHLRKVFSTVSQ